MRLAAGALVVCIMAVVLGWAAAPGLLRVETGGPSEAEALVVLGGEPWTRPQRAAEVFQECGPGLVIVSGEGDGQDVRRQLEARGVPARRIVVEGSSQSTFQNAEFSVRLLRERNVTNAIIVTSWYHSRRALACFCQAAPEITFHSRPTPCSGTKFGWPDRHERKRILQEYAKILYYWAIHGVAPA